MSINLLSLVAVGNFAWTFTVYELQVLGFRLLSAGLSLSSADADVLIHMIVTITHCGKGASAFRTGEGFEV